MHISFGLRVHLGMVMSCIIFGHCDFELDLVSRIILS